MTKVFINANNAKTGGGISIIEGIINNVKNFTHIEFIILVPKELNTSVLCGSNVLLISLPAIFSSTIFSPFVYELYLAKTINKYNVDLIVNFGDLLIKTKIKQIYIFDWPYAVYDDEIIWGALSTSKRYIQRFKKYLIKKRITNAVSVIAQTSVMKERLEQRYGIKNITVLPIPVDFSTKQVPLSINLPRGTNLVYLSFYYPHKNFEILLPLAKKIKELKLDYKIILTLDVDRTSQSASFYRQVKKLKLDNIIVNIGCIPHEQCYDLMKQSDGLLMPTLIETYGIPYLEAMSAEIPIFTSDRDFSRAVCKESAYYFDPHNEGSILEALNNYFYTENSKENKINAGKEIFNDLISWNTYLASVLDSSK
jgi:glycosyltransferase involved in cell wall biosynthesis